MSDDVKIKTENDEVKRLSNFLDEKCENDEMLEFNLDRISDSLSTVNAWENFHIPVMVSDGEIEYFEIEKVEE